jgi:hypothetical protein
MMKTGFLVILLFAVPVFVHGQNVSTEKAAHLPKHYISVNPLNMILFQQLGISYEFKPGLMGYGVTAGYIYANHKDYSNYFIAGPTNYASLGDYRGFFIVPQVNVYLRQPEDPTEGGLIYLSAKMVYKHMQIDSSYTTAWKNEGDSYYVYRKMNDNVNIYGVFLDFGYRYVLSHFFFDLNFGVGNMWVNHDMLISGEHTGYYSGTMRYYHPPKQDELHESHVTINFTLNLGAAF